MLWLGVLLALPLACVLRAQEAAPNSTRAKFSLRYVEVQLKDGSSIRGEIQGLDTITLTTTFGALQFPTEEIYRITRGTGADGKTQSDLVKAARLEARGALQLDGLTLHSNLGDLKLKTAEIQCIRWLARADLKVLDVKAMAALQGWLDTGVDTVRDDTISITCAGGMNLFGQYAGPSGTKSFGGGQFQAGAVIGKLGADGAPFLINAGKKWTAGSIQRVYLKLYSMPNFMQRFGNQPVTGMFRFRVATGVWADEPAPPLTAPDEDGTDGADGANGANVQNAAPGVFMKLGN